MFVGTLIFYHFETGMGEVVDDRGISHSLELGEGLRNFRVLKIELGQVVCEREGVRPSSNLRTRMRLVCWGGPGGVINRFAALDEYEELFGPMPARSKARPERSDGFLRRTGPSLSNAFDLRH